MISVHWVWYIVLGILLLITVGQLLIALRNNRRIQQNYMELQLLAAEAEKNPVEESEKLLSFTRTFITQITILRFSQYRDSHEMEKVTRQNITGLVEEIATLVEKAINFQNIDFENLVFTRGFYDQYVVDFTVDCVKRVHEKEVQQFDAG